MPTPDSHSVQALGMSCPTPAASATRTSTHSVTCPERVKPAAAAAAAAPQAVCGPPPPTCSMSVAPSACTRSSTMKLNTSRSGGSWAASLAWPLPDARAVRPAAATVAARRCCRGMGTVGQHTAVMRWVACASMGRGAPQRAAQARARAPCGGQGRRLRSAPSDPAAPRRSNSDKPVAVVISFDSPESSPDPQPAKFSGT